MQNHVVWRRSSPRKSLNAHGGRTRQRLQPRMLKCRITSSGGGARQEKV